ncbi:hypothetical protein GLOIN_2v708233 [Rhizophagus irregularis DAOM 181602=DAOM 197198]|nr:hypothetical protein GLOIN_2v708233 [Rhizophagus irregularis DAOM 181602=DAOM 197198]CAG8733629.1 10124_t:CDS:1 [Rhizophagus irregularis]
MLSNLTFIYLDQQSPTILQDTPDLHCLFCLLLNLVPSSIVEPFKNAKINKKRIKSLLLKFLFDLHHKIFELLWKTRSVAWKEWKNKTMLQKKTFTNDQKKRRNDNNNSSPNMSRLTLDHIHGYTNPFTNTRRNLDDSILWIYLTSSNSQTSSITYLGLNS